MMNDASHPDRIRRPPIETTETETTEWFRGSPTEYRPTEHITTDHEAEV